MPDHATSSHPAVQAQLDRLATLSPGADILGLDRIATLLERLGDPHLSIPPVFHVAGTNGKGSTCAFLRAAIEAAGHSVHVFSSPHLVRFNERIRVAGKLIEDDALAALLAEVLDIAEGVGASFFEVTTAAAFLAFARTPAAATILEVGLGGRLDATNVVTPAVCGIAQLGIDHQAFLGDRLVDIAAEKAGILKPDVPCVLADQKPEALAVIEVKAAEIGAPLFLEGRDWGGRELPPPNLAGPHQRRNAAIAAAALDHLPGITVSDEAITKGFENIDWPARLQHLQSGALAGILRPDQELWLDGGHNPAAGEAIRDWLALEQQKPLHLVMGMLNSKDPDAFLAPFKDRITSLHAVTIPGEANSLSAEELADRAASVGLAATTAETVRKALEEIVQDQPGPGRILITGSLYLAGKVLAENA